MIASDTPPPGYRHNVGIMLLDRHSRIFVGQRRDMPSPAWQMPQGGIDKGETPPEAAMRELEEEVGTAKAVIVAESAGWLTYDLPPELRRKLWRGRWKGQSQKWFAMRFTGQDDDINIATKHPEFSRWQWAAADSIVSLIVPFKRDLYRAVLEEFAPVLAENSPEA
ncbi:MAG: RNA pyrophosphohydrolase [Reyranellaceae bacterium]